MKRTRILAAGILATSILAGAGTVASADPVITTTLGYMPSEGTLGQSFDVIVDGCPVSGGEVYVGGYLEGASFPAPYINPDRSTDGTWTAHVDLSDPAIGSVTAHVYCASAPVTSLDDPAVMWVSPGYDFTVVDQGGAPLAAAAATSRTSFAAVQNDGPAAGLTVDKDALPVLDRIGLTGEQAAAYKEQVDAQVSTIGMLDRLYETYVNRLPTASELKSDLGKLNKGKSFTDIAKGLEGSKGFKAYGKLSDGAFIDRLSRNAWGQEASAELQTWFASAVKAKTITRSQMGVSIADSQDLRDRMASTDYVVTAFQVLSGKSFTAEQVAQQVELLDSTLATKVQIVENIYLATHAKKK